MTERIIAQDAADGVRLLRFNRPEKLNAFDLAMRQALQTELERAAAEPAIRALVLTGSERAFIAGADLAAVATATAQDMAQARLHEIWDYLDGYSKPLVMAVSGYCLGAGCEVMMHGDIVVVADDARIGQPEITLGIQPGAGGLSRLVRLVGYHRAMLLAMTGEQISGTQAAAWGLASECVAANLLLDRALERASKIAAMSGERTASIRRIARQGLDLSLSDQLQNERKAYWEAFGTADQREGMAAFLEKRPACFNQGEGQA